MKLTRNLIIVTICSIVQIILLYGTLSMLVSSLGTMWYPAIGLSNWYEHFMYFSSVYFFGIVALFQVFGLIYCLLNRSSKQILPVYLSFIVAPPLWFAFVILGLFISTSYVYVSIVIITILILSNLRFFTKPMKLLFIVLSIFVFIYSFIINFKATYCAEKTQMIQDELIPLTQKDISTFREFPVPATTSSMIGSRFIGMLYCENDFELSKVLKEKFLPF